MVITRVTYYKCKAPPRTYHYVTLRDKVHLAHLWLGTSLAHLWGYSPYLNVFCVLAQVIEHRARPKRLSECTQLQEQQTKGYGKTSSPFFSGSAPDLPL